jgi:surface polysaccharide O-acyltransferase-like enzyme
MKFLDICKLYPDITDFRNIPLNLTNLVGLLYSLYLSSTELKDFRIYLIFIFTIINALFKCNSCKTIQFTNCLYSTITLLYPLIFGFFIKKYRNEKKYKKSNNLLLLFYFIIFIFIITSFNNSENIFKQNLDDGEYNLLKNYITISYVILIIIFSSLKLGLGALLNYIPYNK